MSIFDRVNSRLDRYDAALCRRGIVKWASWDAVLSGEVSCLYAGQLFRSLPQFRTHYGLSLSNPASRNIRHDVRNPMPVPDNLLSIYQAEDVFEHVPLDDLPIVFDEIFRVLRPGGLFRFSVPDYRSDIYLERSLRDSAGHILFDPGGGGAFCDGKVVDGGHLWHPVYETVKTLFETSKFGTQGRVEYLHHVAPDGGFILREIDYSLGRVSRTPDFDERVRRPRRPLSIVVDAWK